MRLAGTPEDVAVQPEPEWLLELEPEVPLPGGFVEIVYACA